MSLTNYFYNLIKALEQNKVTVTGTYTVRVGTVANGFAVDRVIDVDDPAADFTLTVPDGEQIGQELLIVMSSNGSSKTCTVSVTHHANADSGTASLDAADEYLKLIYTGTEWDTIAYDGCSDIS